MRRTSVLAAPAVVRVHQDALEPASDLGSMTRLFLLLTVTASAASAQASPEGATSSAAVWIESGGGFGYVLEPGDDAGWDVLGGALRLGVAPAGGPLFTEVGVVGWYEFWGRDELVGGHVSVGGRWGRFRSRPQRDPRYSGCRGRSATTRASLREERASCLVCTRVRRPSSRSFHQSAEGRASGSASRSLRTSRAPSRPPA
ncbi:MAG: hypothetical protein AAGK21_05935 [Bacteroidota bacterium]